VYTEARTALIPVLTRISSLTAGGWRSLRITVFGTYQGASNIVRNAFDWKRSRISVLEVEGVPWNCIPYVQIGLSIALYMRILLLVDSFNLRPSLYLYIFKFCT
jgi:hypothetical protein